MGDWLRHPVLGVVAFAIIGLGLTAFANEYQIIHRDDDLGADYYSATSGQTRPTQKIPQANPEPERAEWREEKHLESQQWMVIWTGAMFFITSAGVWYIAKTLDATKEATLAANNAAKITKDIGEAQTRAWMSDDSLDILPSFGGPNGSVFHGVIFSIRWQNHGRTPALNVRVANDGNDGATSKKFNPHRDVHELLDKSASSCTVPPGGPQIAAGSEFRTPEQIVWMRDHPYRVRAVCVYDTIHDLDTDNRRISELALKITYTAPYTAEQIRNGALLDAHNRLKGVFRIENIADVGRMT